MSGVINKIVLLGREFTVQTEFIPGPPPKVRTLVYDGGRLVSSRESPLDGEFDTPELIERQVHRQHTLITDNLFKRTAELWACKTEEENRPPPQVSSPPSAPMTGRTRPEVTPGSRLETAIAVRRIVGPFSHSFGRPAPASTRELEKLLRAVDAEIDHIMAEPVFEHIRLDEQISFIAIKAQVTTSLLSIGSPAAAGIWPTIQRFAIHLENLNNRSDLLAFDHALLMWAMSELGSGTISGELLEGLGQLAGREPRLDFFLANPDEMDQQGLFEVLMGLLDRTLV
jgi:hypothetical protein